VWLQLMRGTPLVKCRLDTWARIAEDVWALKEEDWQYCFVFDGCLSLSVDILFAGFDLRLSRIVFLSVLQLSS
jgi:hypothetical protein